MPQFELEDVGPASVSGLVRGRTMAQALLSAGHVGEDCFVEIVETEDPAGWMDVRIDGESSGRVREHSRMRFRRD